MIIDIDGYEWEFSYIDSTHGKTKMVGTDGRPWVFHIGELTGRPYQEKVRQFLREESKFAYSKGL